MQGVGSHQVSDHFPNVRKMVDRGFEQVEGRGPKWEFLSSHVARRTYVALLHERGVREVLMSFTGHRSH